MQVSIRSDVEQEYVEKENKNIPNYLSLSLEHMSKVVGKTNQDPVDIAME
jgi:hypothetical protein